MPTKNKNAQLSESELQERISILKKLRAHLLEQRNRFYDYLELLEQEQEDILYRDAEKLKAHTDIEKEIVQEIYTFQKVIDPLEELYHVSYPNKDAETDNLKRSLRHIQEEVLRRSKRNQDLLHKRMDEVRNEIKSIRKVYKNKPVYNADTENPSMIDIST